MRVFKTQTLDQTGDKYVISENQIKQYSDKINRNKSPSYHRRFEVKAGNVKHRTGTLKNYISLLYKLAYKVNLD